MTGKRGESMKVAAWLGLRPTAFLLSLAGFSLAGPALSAEVKYDPGDKVYFTYCYAHPPAARIGDHAVPGLDARGRGVGVAISEIDLVARIVLDFGRDGWPGERKPGKR